MAIYTYLDLSTSHVTPRDMALLASSRNQSIHALSYPEGCVITAFWGGDSGVEQERADLLDELRADGYSALFCDMIQHAATLDEYIKESRKGKLRDQDNALQRAGLEKQADAMNKRLGLKDYGAPFHASHDGRRLVVSVRTRYLDVTEDKVEELLKDLREVLKRHGAK